MAIERLEPDDTRPAFSCGDADLDEYYNQDSIEGGQQLVSVTYIYTDGDSKVLAYFSLSNDSINKEECGRSPFKRLSDALPISKRYSSLPAAKIGRLGICIEQQGAGIGTEVLDYLKAWFTHNNKTGCRFLIVDAYNKEEVIRFYEKNDFRFLSTKDERDQHRIMYFDLIEFRP